MKNRPLLIAGLFAVLFVLSAVFADFFSTAPPEAQNLENFYAPPTRIHFVDGEGVFHCRPRIYRTVLTDPLDSKYEEVLDRAYPLEFWVRGYPYKVLGVFPSERHFAGSTGNIPFHLLGADELGRDVLARLLAGARTSLVVVLAGILMYGALGLAIGTLAGLSGGWVDSLLMRFSEFVLAIPALYLILSLRALLPLRIGFYEGLLITVGAIAAVTWPPMARGVRGLILQLRNAGYVEAARSLGCSSGYIFRRHIFPSILPFLLSQMIVAAPIFLLGEVILSFLDVGVRNSGESWGSMLRNLKDARTLTDFYWNMAPLCLIVLTLLALNMFSKRLGRPRPEDQWVRI